MFSLLLGIPSVIYTNILSFFLEDIRVICQGKHLSIGITLSDTISFQVSAVRSKS